MSTSTFRPRSQSVTDALESYRAGMTHLEAARLRDVPVDQIIKLSSNENPLGAPRTAVSALIALADAVALYPESTATELHAEIGNYLGVDGSQVVSGAGSSTLMHAIVDACSEPGGEVVWMSPGFTVYQEIATTHRRVPRECRLAGPDFQPEFERLLAGVTDNTHLIFLTRPNNPTGVLTPLETVAKVARAARAVGAVVVSDEAYIEFADDPHESAVELVRGQPDEFDNVIVTRTFSKAFGLANLRLGYMVGSRQLARVVSASNAKWPTGDLVRAAGVAALRDRDHLRDTRALVSTGRTVLADGLEQLGYYVVPHSQANYIMVDVSRKGWTGADFASMVLEAGNIMIRGDFSSDHVRISVGTHEQNTRLIATVDQLGSGPRVDI